MKTTHVALLALATAIVIGYGWSIDMPQAIQVPLREAPFYYTSMQFNMLYFFTYLPIFIFDIPIGIVLDKLPVEKTIIFLVFISFISQFVTVYLFQFRFTGYLLILYFMRAIFGVAGQGLFTVQALIISNYGKKYYQLLMGFSLCIPFLFDSLNCTLTPVIYDATQSITLVWYIGSLFCFISLICGVFIAYILKAQIKLEKQSKLAIKQKAKSQKLSIKSAQFSQENKKKQSSKYISQQVSVKEGQNNSQSNQEDDQQEGFSFQGVKKMNKAFWVIIGAVFFTQYSLGSFIDNLNDTLVKRFQIPYVTAGQLLILPYGLASLISISLGKMLQLRPKWRRKSYFSASLSYFIGVTGLFFLPNVQPGQTTPIIHYILIVYFCISMSFAFAQLYACLCSCIIYVVQKKKYIGTAWGIVGSAIGLSECIGPISNTLMISTDSNLGTSYKNLTLYTCFISLMTLVFSIWLLVGDFSQIDTNYETHHSEKQSKDNLRQSLISQDLETTRQVILS